MREEIILFLQMKGIVCDFEEKMSCEEWKYEFMFTIDMFGKLNELNVKLQGKGMLVHKMLENLKSFRNKLSLFARQAGERKFCHFPLMEKQKVSSSASSKVKSHLLSLENEMANRFQDFERLNPEISLISQPFSTDIDTAPDDVQLELIDLQADNVLKEKFNNMTIPDFYQHLSPDQYPCMKEFAAKLMSIFGSTYICEQSFSCMKINKSKCRSVLTDANLQAIMRIATSSYSPNFKQLVKNCERLHSSH